MRAVSFPDTWPEGGGLKFRNNRPYLTCEGLIKLLQPFIVPLLAFSFLRKGDSLRQRGLLKGYNLGHPGGAPLLQTELVSRSQVFVGVSYLTLHTPSQS